MLLLHELRQAAHGRLLVSRALAGIFLECGHQVAEDGCAYIVACPGEDAALVAGRQLVFVYEGVNRLKLEVDSGRRIDGAALEDTVRATAAGDDNRAVWDYL